MTDELAVASATNFVAHGQHFLDVVNQVAENENHESNLVLLLLALADLLAAVLVLLGLGRSGSGSVASCAAVPYSCPARYCR